MRRNEFNYVDILPIDFLDRKDDLNLEYKLDHIILRNIRSLVSEGVITKIDAETLSLKLFGITNKQIAQFLFIKQRAVEKRITNVYNKLRTHFGHETSEESWGFLIQILRKLSAEDNI
jgi:DNA-binding CsgD family transcriptional regulator